MPTYKNIGNNIEVINSKTIKPLEEVEVYFYIDENKYPFLKLISEEPIYSPVAYSEIAGSGSSVKILENMQPDVNMIRLLSKSDSALVSFNSEDAPKVLLTNADPLALRGLFKFNEVFIHEGTVSVELWREFSWRN